MQPARTDTSYAERPVALESPAPADVGETPGVARIICSPFDRVVRQRDRSLLADDILPAGWLLECVGVDALNCFINYVDLKSVITERDPEEEERYISISNQFYTHFHEFGTVIHVVATSAQHWWYFCYDIDSNDCVLGRVAHERSSLPEMVEWVYHTRVSRKYPVVELDIRNLKGWRAFQ